jgi:hypothetical protein
MPTKYKHVACVLRITKRSMMISNKKLDASRFVSIYRIQNDKQYVRKRTSIAQYVHIVEYNYLKC